MIRHIINLEGIDGTGKNTVSQELRKIFESQGYKVFTLHFPVYGTPTGELIKSFLSGTLVDDPTVVDPITSSLYYTVDRLTYFKNNPQIFTDYDILIFDRSYMSNFFFQTVKYVPKDQNVINIESYNTDITNYIRTMYKLEIKNSPLHNYEDQIQTFLLFHPDINTNFRLMGLRGGPSDMHESNKTYLQAIHDNAMNVNKSWPMLAYELNQTNDMAAFRAYSYTPIRCSDRKGELREINDIAMNIVLEADRTLESQKYINKSI